MCAVVGEHDAAGFTGIFECVGFSDSWHREVFPTARPVPAAQRKGEQSVPGSVLTKASEATLYCTHNKILIFFRL
ncbi:hypothetical protein EXN66_Car009047 [Channa argus]|uniref:Uncharacterized protein n=1 Tax=Channa argus TaxID=215402 RepID=A0A6G1PSQ1_CHAAH|nr:hypothetical protein EXN66_Car009047 [Channa argus]